MKQFLDFFTAGCLFSRFYKIYDIYAATAALIVATAIVLIYSWVRFRKVEKMAPDHFCSGGRLRWLDAVLPQ